MASFSSLDLNLLVTLDALLRARHVTRAARQLGISQSAMSHRLKKLREALGDPLFVGSARGLVPTRRAAELEQPLRETLQRMQALLAGPKPFDPATSERRFVVAGSDYGELALIPDLVARLRRLAPRIDLVCEQRLPDVVRQLEDGRVDLVVGPPLPDRAGVKTRKLGKNVFVVVFREGHPLATQRLTLARYLAASHLLVAPQGAARGLVDDVLARRGKSRRVALVVRHFSTAPFIVARSDLLWTAPREIAVKASEHFALELARSPVELPSFDYFMTWHERAHADPAHQWLRRMILDVRASTRSCHESEEWL